MRKKPVSPIESHFRALWNRRPVHHELNTIQAGVSAFMELSRLNRERLSKRLFMTQSQVVNLESRGKPANYQVLTRLIQLCQDYRFPELEDLFRKKRTDIEVTSRRFRK